MSVESRSPVVYERAQKANASAETALSPADPRNTRRAPTRSASDERTTSETG